MNSQRVNSAGFLSGEKTGIIATGVGNNDSEIKEAISPFEIHIIFI
ncbi:MAG: hypothetical protein ABI688_03675 [Bacteroidota bacterium]